MKIVGEYELVEADAASRDAAVLLLKRNNLPVGDLDPGKHLFVLTGDNVVAGTGGLEFFGDCALLRSVCVSSHLQGKGLGKMIARELEIIAKRKGVDCLYLLTSTAKDFFEKEGYEVITRQDAPQSIKDSSEFSMLACSTATVMRKKLA